MKDLFVLFVLFLISMMQITNNYHWYKVWVAADNHLPYLKNNYVRLIWMVICIVAFEVMLSKF